MYFFPIYAKEKVNFYSSQPYTPPPLLMFCWEMYMSISKIYLDINFLFRVFCNVRSYKNISSQPVTAFPGFHSCTVHTAGIHKQI